MKQQNVRSAHAHMRATNLRSIISAIRNSPGISRGEIQAETRLSHGAVSQMITELMEKGWVLETEQDGPRQKGRRSRAIVVNPHRANALAIRVDSNEVQGSLFDLAGNRQTDASFPVKTTSHRDEILLGIHSVAQQLVTSAASETIGVGIAVPGSVDALTGMAQSASRISGWRDVDLRGKVAQALGLPTFVENDVRLLARGHRAANLIDAADVALSVWVGEGVGAGITIEGQLFRGAGGLAGELGHLHVDPEGALCTCGNRGCLETIAATPAVLSRTMTALSHGVSSQITAHAATGGITLEAIAAALQQGDKLALTVTHHVAKALAKALAQAINLISPSKILLAGPLMALGQPLLSDIEMHLQLYAHWEIMKGLKLKSTGVSEEYILQGAAAMALDSAWTALEMSL